MAELKQLRDTIGKSGGRITIEQQYQRQAVLFKIVPKEVWPSTGGLIDKHLGQTAIICGGGPSLAKTFPALEAAANNGAIVFAPNKSHDWLINGEKGQRRNRYKRKPLIPQYGVLVDPSLHIADYITPHPKVHYLLGTMLHFKTHVKFLKAESKVSLWVPTHDEEAKDILIAAEFWPDRPMQFISGGSTVGLRTIGLIVSMGCDTLELHGFDSCYAPHTKSLYAYEKPYTTTEYSNPTAIAPNGDQLRFESNQHMSKQAMEFEDFCQRLSEMVINGTVRDVKIRVHGDGVIPWMAWKSDKPNISHAAPDEMFAKYGESKYFDYASGKAQDDAFVVTGETPIGISTGLEMVSMPSFFNTNGAGL